MDTDADTIEVELPPDMSKQSDGTETTVKTADPVAEFKSEFENLKQQTAQHGTEKAALIQRATAAEQAAAAARQEVAVAKSQVADSQLDTIESGLQAAKTEADAAEAAYVAAQESGDWKAAGKAQRAIAAAEARIVRLDEAKADIETRKATGGKVEEPQRQQQTIDPVEQLISRHTPRAQSWLREHKDYITDQKKNAKLQAAHHDAIGEGFAPDTDEYVSHVESFLGLKTESKTNGAGNGKEQPRRRVTPPVAPGSAAPGGTNGGGDVVRLTKGEADAATDGTHVWNYDDPSPQKRFKRGDPIGIQEMARRKLELQKQGAYDRSFTEQ